MAHDADVTVLPVSLTLAAQADLEEWVTHALEHRDPTLLAWVVGEAPVYGVTVDVL